MQRGLIGAKLGHSFSKIIHEMFGKYQYDLIELPESELKDFLKQRNFAGINVTIPYKKKVLEAVDYIDHNCLKIGSCNTIVNRHNKLYAYNTDYDGFDYMLKKHHVNILNKKVVILGDGGAAAAVKAVIQNYQPAYLVSCKKHFSEHTISYEKLYADYNDAEILINTSPVGMYPNNDADLVELTKFKNLALVIDIIYNPLKTKLLIAAQDSNISTIGGLEMLVAQAVYAYQHFTDQKVAAAEIDKIYQKIYESKINYVLIGMPGAGKSTIAQALKKQLHKEVIDIDEEIEKYLQMSIKTYLSQHTEAEFREIETAITKKVAKRNSVIIATGGGIVLNPENIAALKQNGKIIYLKRAVANLAITDSRPLSKNRKNLEKMYQKRHPMYVKSADYIIDNNKSCSNCVQQIVEIKEKNK